MKSISPYTKLFWRFSSNFLVGTRMEGGNAMQEKCNMYFSYKQNWEHLIKTYQIMKRIIPYSETNPGYLYFENNLVVFLLCWHLVNQYLFCIQIIPWQVPLHYLSQFKLSNCSQEEKMYHIQATGQPRAIWTKTVAMTRWDTNKNTI